MPTPSFFFFFFNDTATTEIYTLSLHDALPISGPTLSAGPAPWVLPNVWPPAMRATVSSSFIAIRRNVSRMSVDDEETVRSEEHTSELQSRQYLVCRLLLEKKNRGSSHNSPVSF